MEKGPKVSQSGNSSTDNQNQVKLLGKKESEYKLDDQKGQRITIKLMMKERTILLQASLLTTFWKEELSLNEFYKFSAVFLVDQSLEELFLHLEEIFDSNQASLENKGLFMNLLFNINLKHKSIQFQIPLEQGEAKMEQVIQDLQTQLTQAQAEIMLLKEELQKSRISTNSKIMQDSEKDMVYSWVSRGKEVSHLDLLYRATTNGFQGSAFSLRCDGKGPLICFVQSQNKRRFGGYIHLKYQKDLNGYVAAKPNLSFLFSLDDKKQYLSNETSRDDAYYSCCTHGFTMGSGFDLQLANNCNCNDDSMSRLSETYGKKQGGNETSLAGSENFVVDEIEVFQVFFKDMKNLQK